MCKSLHLSERQSGIFWLRQDDVQHLLQNNPGRGGSGRESGDKTRALSWELLGLGCRLEFLILSIRVHLKFSIIKRIFLKNLSSFLKDFQNVVYLFIGHAGLELRTWCKFRALHATSWNLFKKQNQLKRERDVQRSGLDPRSFGPYLMFRGAWESHQFSLSTKATQGHPRPPRGCWLYKPEGRPGQVLFPPHGSCTWFLYTCTLQKSPGPGTLHPWIPRDTPVPTD